MKSLMKMNVLKKAMIALLMAFLMFVGSGSIKWNYFTMPALAQPALAQPVKVLNDQEADKELYDQYKTWKKANPPINHENAPDKASTITIDTANKLRNKWQPKSNSWTSSERQGFYDENTRITQWVTGSVSGGKQVKDFHASWADKNGQRYRFLWHFRVN